LCPAHRIHLKPDKEASATIALLNRALETRYHVSEEIGRGGMAVVYKADDLKHGRVVALKVLQPHFVASLGRERFLPEIAVTARLDHAHILPLLDSGEAGEVLYYVMPFVDGESLRARLNREKQLPLDDALRIALEVADALSYAHARGIVHRDIKPENILLGSSHARVADFGIARALTAAGTEAFTETGLVISTPDYMSPEKASGRAVDARSDLAPAPWPRVGQRVYDHARAIALQASNRLPALAEVTRPRILPAFHL
jgi:serine/threonine protein kinase